MIEKYCICCNIKKQLLDFTKSLKSKDGTRNKCKQCTNKSSRASVREYRTKNVEAIRAHQRDKYYKNLDATRAKNNLKYHNNKEKRAESARKYAANNMEKRRAWDRAWRAANREYNVNKLAGKRALLRNLSDFDRFVLDEAAKLCSLRQKLIGGVWEIDHIKPVSLGGTSEHMNIQVVPKSWNASKGNRHCEKFFR